MESQRTAESHSTLWQRVHHQRAATSGRHLRAPEAWAPLGVGAGLAALTALIVLLQPVVHSVGTAAWLYLLLVLPVTLQRGARLGLITVMLAVLLLLLLPLVAGWPQRVATADEFARLLLALVGMVLTVLLLDRAQRGRLAAERRNATLAERARLADSAEAARAQAEAALRTRDQYLAAITHDLQTPLTTIKGTAQLLQRRLVADCRLDRGAQVTMLEGIDRAATVIAAMIGDLLQIRRLESGQPLDLMCSSCDLVALVQRVANDIQQATGERRVVVDVQAPQLCGVWDAQRLERVVGNLLSNACKYSASDSVVTVTLGRQRDDRAALWATLTVRDHGCGIPTTDLPQLFTPFHRGANVRGRLPGLGIGLASSQAIVEQHGGTVTVTSVEGQGTTATVRLPL